MRAWSGKGRDRLTGEENGAQVTRGGTPGPNAHGKAPRTCRGETSLEAGLKAVPPRSGATFDLDQGRGRAMPGRAGSRRFGAGRRPSRWACLRAALRARRTASAFSRVFFSDGFS
jgi:hypothetical protein